MIPMYLILAAARGSTHAVVKNGNDDDDEK